MTEQQGVDGAGRRVRMLRKLAGLTQVQLAHRAHVSASLLTKVEQGRVPASPYFVAAVADALHVSVPELYDQPVPRFGSERSGVAALETAVMAGSALATDGPTAPVDVLSARSADLLAARKRSRYDRIATDLPGLLVDAHTAVATLTGNEQRHAWRVLAEAHLHALVVLYRLGSDVAGQAADAGVRAAEHADDPVLGSVITVDGCLPLMQRGAYAAVETITDRARTMLDDAPDGPGVRSARGFAHLRAAIVTARQGDPARSAEHLNAAGRDAEQVPATANVHGTTFNRDNVILHGVAAAVEAGDGEQALRRRAPLGRGVTPSRRAHHHVDLSRACLLAGDRDGTLRELNAARRAAPQLTRYHPQVHETVRVLAETDRRRTDTLAGFARWAGIAV